MSNTKIASAVPTGLRGLFEAEIDSPITAGSPRLVSEKAISAEIDSPITAGSPRLLSEKAIPMVGLFVNRGNPTPNKMQMVREAIAELGTDAKPIENSNLAVGAPQYPDKHDDDLIVQIVPVEKQAGQSEALEEPTVP